MQPRLLIRGARILDPANQLDQVGDLLLADGKIAAVGEDVTPGESDAPLQEIDANGLVCTPGLVDAHVHLREPGQEYKEDVRSGSRAAVAGGFTAVCCMPNTSPPNDCRAVTDLILAQAREANLARVYPVAAVTRGLLGEALTEMGELQAAGAVAVSDDGHPVSAGGMMRRALEYASTFNLPVINHCEDLSLSKGAAIHEGEVSVRTGLPSQPASAEVAMLARDLILCGETGARYHAAHVSAAESVALIRRAKEQGLPVTAEVTVHHVALNDEINLGYDTNTKCNPPMRGEADREACLAGLIDGTLDTLCTDHAPHSPTDKAVEFDDAPFGIIGLETALPVALGLVGKELTLPTLIERLTVGPARALGLPVGSLSVGAAADVTLIDPEVRWTIQPEHFQSKSRNTPFAGWDVKGRAVTTIVDGRVVYEWPAGVVGG